MSSSGVNKDQLSADELQLRAQGHVGELPRLFSALSTLSLAFSITNSWIGYSAVFVTPLFVGGGPAVIYCLLVAAVSCSFITAGLAELSSAYPSSGGQYHFAFMVTPPHLRAGAAFLTGWLSVLGWLFTAASACIFCAQVCIDLASLFDPTFTGSQWQIYLIYALILWICAFVVICLPKWIPLAQTIFFSASLLGFVVFFISVLAVSRPKLPAKEIFVEWENQSGWTDGVAFLIGVGQAMYTFVAVDSASHISEEMPNPSKAVPQAMWLTVLIGTCTTVPWTIAFMFGSNDLTAVGSSALPIMEVYLQALRGSKAGAAFLTVWLLFVYFGATIACVLTTGRLTWAFARDNGFPWSRILAVTHPKLQVPVNATLFSTIFCTLYGLIYIGSQTAFNSFISMSILSLNITYAIPQFIVLIRRVSRFVSSSSTTKDNSDILPPRPFNLGLIFGTFCNLFSTLWVLLYTILFCFPSFLPVMAGSMNYVSVVLVASLLWIAVLWWGCGKKTTFTGPDIDEIEGEDGGVGELLAIVGKREGQREEERTGTGKE